VILGDEPPRSRVVVDQPAADMKAQSDIRIANDGRWADNAADVIREISEEAIRAHGRFLLVLSGGSTPQRLYKTLADPEWNERFDWARMVFLFGDERCVPPDHPESNYGMARAALFQPLGIRSDQIYRMKGEGKDAPSAAREYEEAIRALTNSPAPTIPRLDLILLGLGDDGHTASLFPGTAALHDRTHLVTVGHSPKGVTLRLTLTPGVINGASVILFLVTGSAKASTVRRVLQPGTDADSQLPAALIRSTSGRVIWLLDQSAASELIGSRSQT
jgi:6-phosphogluconolactonase